MGEPLQPLRNRGYQGGLGRRLFAWDIDDSQATILQNASTKVPGMTQVRGGSGLTATGITMGPILALGAFSPESSVGDTVLLAISPTHTDDALTYHRLWEWDGSASVWTMVAQLTGLTTITGFDISITQVYDTSNLLAGDTRYAVLLSTGGVDGDIARKAYDGSAMYTTNYGSSASAHRHPSSAAVEFGGYRLVGAGSGNAASRLFTSPYGGALTANFGQGSQFTMGGNSNSRVVAIKQFRQNEFVVFMDDRIEILGNADVGLDSGLGDLTSWYRRVVDPTVGCGSRRSVAVLGQEIYFVDQYGNVRTIVRTIQDVSQGTKSLPVSNEIQEYVDTINKQHLANSIGWAHDRFYYIAFPLETAVDASHVFCYDTTRGTWDGPWTYPNGIKGATVAVLSDAAAPAAYKNPTIFVGTNRAEWGEVIALDQGTDDSGTAISYLEQSKRYTYGEPALKKRWTRLEVYAVASGDIDLTVEANVDQTGWVSLGTMNILGSSPVLPQTLPFGLGGFGVVQSKFSLEGLDPGIDIQFRISGDVDDEVKILGHTLLAHPENFDWNEVSN